MPPSQPRVLVSHEITGYAEALTAFLADCRPDLRVHCLTPLELDAAISADPKAVVVTDWLTPAITAQAAGWLLFCPQGHENVAVLGGEMGIERIEDATFPDIVAAIDRLVGRHAPHHGRERTMAKGKRRPSGLD